MISAQAKNTLNMSNVEFGKHYWHSVHSAMSWMPSNLTGYNRRWRHCTMVTCRGCTWVHVHPLRLGVHPLEVTAVNLKVIAEVHFRFHRWRWGGVSGLGDGLLGITTPLPSVSWCPQKGRNQSPMHCTSSWWARTTVSTIHTPPIILPS